LFFIQELVQHKHGADARADWWIQVVTWDTQGRNLIPRGVQGAILFVAHIFSKNMFILTIDRSCMQAVVSCLNRAKSRELA
jgi:hypothetical protein